MEDNEQYTRFIEEKNLELEDKHLQLSRLLYEKETQALQEELIKTNAEKLHAQIVADAAIEELNALKEKLKDGVIVPKVATEEVKEAILEAIYDSMSVETSWGGVNSASIEFGIDEAIYEIIVNGVEQSHD